MSDYQYHAERIRALTNRGAYRAATSYAAALPFEITRSPSIALEIARNFLRQGYPVNAESSLAAADVRQATPGEQLILTLETEALRVYRHVQIREAVVAAATALANVNSSIDATDLAEAERVHTRILLIAATYYEITPEAAARARDQLPQISKTLEQAGRIDQSLAAGLTYAEKLTEPLERIDELLKFAVRASSAGRPNIAAEARLLAATQMIIEGQPRSAIEDTLNMAATLYEEGEHEHGHIDVQLARAKLQIEREFAGTNLLEDCLRAYQEIDFPRGELSALMDLSQLAHERGDTATAATYRNQTLALSEQIGMGLTRDSFQTAQADLLMRNGDYGGAIEICEAAISTNPPAMLKALFEQLLGTAYSFINDLDESITHTRNALAMFENLNAIDAASDAVMKLTSDLSSLRQEDAWQEAEELLQTWSSRDEERRDFSAAVSKQEMIAQVKILRFLYSNVHRGEVRLLDEAEAAVAKAEALTHGLTERESFLRRGNLQQLRGQIHQARNDEDSVIQAWRNALSLFEQAGFEIYAANCRYMLGVIFLNRANQDLANFNEAEDNLRAALEYYERAKMRGQSADTRFMFARLYVNASVRVQIDLSTQLLDAALDHLREAAADYDSMRQDFNAGASILEVQGGKRSLIEKSQRIYQLALDVTSRFRPAAKEAWHWVQHAKARALSDVLGSGSTPPARVMAQLEKHPDSFKLVLDERELALRIAKASAGERIGLREDLETLRARMGQDSSLAEYLEFRTGSALDWADLELILNEDAVAGRQRVCIDWYAVEDRLFLIAARTGAEPQMVRLPLPLSMARAFVADNLGPENFRGNLLDAPEILRELDPLISPLAQLSNPEDLLILSPTGPLHLLPLHALEIDSEPLLARNPIVYCPSLSVMRQCLARHRTLTNQPVTALFGDPNGDRAEAFKLMARLEQLLVTTAFTGKDVTLKTFSEAIAGRDLIHFQGHAVHVPGKPLDSFLALADGNLKAREIFGLSKLSAELVTLAACESAASVIAVGDEPLGLIPAFLYAGANSVLATLWRVHQTSAALTMRIFYEQLTDRDTLLDKALSLRKAMLTVRSTPGFDAPYHWAPFVLHGSWR